jgi:hypothetical protein
VEEVLRVKEVLALQCEAWYMYGPVILYMPPALLHCMVMNAFKGTVNLRPVFLGQ